MLGHIHQTIACVVLAGAMAAGCAASGGAAADEADSPGRVQTKEGQKRPLGYYESTLNPSDFDQEVTMIQRVHEEEQLRQDLLIPRDSLVMQEEQILGFRIQLLSSSNVDDATAGKLAAQMVFTADTVYVVYDPPVYKVRIGDFPSRLEANQRLPIIQEQGYPDAWVVPDKVIRRKLVGVRKAEVQE